MSDAGSSPLSVPQGASVGVPAHQLPIAVADQYSLELSPTHTFPADKITLLKEQLLYTGVVHPEQLYTPELLAEDRITRVHNPDYWQRLRQLALTPAEVRRLGLPLSERLVMRAWASASCGVAAAEQALSHGVGIHLGGGTHHAFAQRAEAYCLLNDIALSATELLAQGRIARPLVVDLDVHQGNGTAEMLAHEPRAFTFSMHGDANYPARKAHSDLDIALPRGTPDGPYLDALTHTLPQLIDQHRPDLIYYLSGADPLATDRLGTLALTPQGLAERDRFVFAQAAQHGIPLVLLLGGGYPRSFADVPVVIAAHARTVALALSVLA